MKKEEFEDIFLKTEELHKRYQYIPKLNDNEKILQDEESKKIANLFAKIYGKDKFTQEDLEELKKGKFGSLYRNTTLDSLNKGDVLNER